MDEFRGISSYDFTLWNFKESNLGMKILEIQLSYENSRKLPVVMKVLEIFPSNEHSRNSAQPKMTRNDLKKLLEENQDVNPMVLLTNMSGHWRIWWRHRRFQQSHLLEVQEQGTCVDILNITCIFYAESSLLMHENLFLHNTCLHFWLGSP